MGWASAASVAMDTTSILTTGRALVSAFEANGLIHYSVRFITVYLMAMTDACFKTEVKDFLMIATSLAVRGIPLNLSLQEDLTLPLSGLATSFSGSAVEFDGKKENIFYNDRSRGLVYKSNLNGTGNGFLRSSLVIKHHYNASL